MNHNEAEELIGAYALDAVSDEEAAAIEAHLESCPRCAGELDSYRAAAAMIGNVGAAVPEGLWDKISSELTTPESSPVRRDVVVPIRSAPRSTINLWRGAAVALTLAAAAVLAVFAVQIGNLHSEVHHLNDALGRHNLSAAVMAAEAAPHSTIQLASKAGTAVTFVVSGNDEAYWVSSSLPRLRHGRTYQLWGLTDGRIVSLGLAGSDPHNYSVFRLPGRYQRLMVTAEPAGGTSRPTGTVLASAQV